MTKFAAIEITPSIKAGIELEVAKWAAFFGDLSVEGAEGRRRLHIANAGVGFVSEDLASCIAEAAALAAAKKTRKARKPKAPIEIEAGDIVEIVSGKDAGFRGMFDRQFRDEAGDLKMVVLFDGDEFAYVDAVRFVSRPA